ncbi:hypothetical protein F4695_004637 [Rhizobium soli]|uniref:Uncharacterized protein n=1 Tax=Rhizobium soli TaxID=424798 RepID=A0A7X0MWC8_9HYPH|nr:hypothetical protein [Rhizobium soli]
MFCVGGYLTARLERSLHPQRALLIRCAEPSDNAERPSSSRRALSAPCPGVRGPLLSRRLCRCNAAGHCCYCPSLAGASGFREDRSSRIGWSRAAPCWVQERPEGLNPYGTVAPKWRPFVHVLQIADIARPGISLQGLEVGVRQRHLAPVGDALPSHRTLGDEGNVFPPVPPRHDSIGKAARRK